MDAVTTVLLERARGDEGLRRTLSVSLAVHVAAAIALVVTPGVWRSAPAEISPRTVMTISLGGGSGPRSGGLNPMGGRPVQTTEPAARPEALRPPAPKEPEMSVPDKPSPARKTPEPKTAAPREARGATPTRGAEVTPGSAVAETGARGMGFGLSSGGGGGTGSYVEGGSFCCPDYLSLMLDRVQRNWAANQQFAGVTMIRFTIRRDGQITDVVVERSSGRLALDYAAQRALLTTKALPPLPGQYPNATLTVHLNFEYQR